MVEENQEILEFEDLAKESVDKIITDYETPQRYILKANGKSVGFDYKPIRKGTLIKAQNKGDEELMMNYVLENSLWYPPEERFRTIQEIDSMLPPDWQILIFAVILKKSGLSLKKVDMDF